ncbi:MAG: molecular chaperone [Gammaproteobacteria bacterium]|nr:molecular chaperone [Gammaproteobacteria bacterium]MDE2345439.1 molecular chaperone [Gammaproteobacteria bacterium]
MQKILILLVLAMTPLWAAAASFQVNPVRVTLSAQHSTDVLRVTNSSNTPTLVQLQIEAWSQNNNRDVYTPSRNLLATPPIFTVAPGSQQVVRIGMRTHPETKQETCYRLFLTEVPPAPAPGFRGVQIALRVGIPIFVEPANTIAPDIHWSMQRLSATSLRLSAVNQGTAHLQILKLELSKTGQSQPVARENGGYILPGAQASWEIKLPATLAANQPLDLTATTDQGTLHAQLVPGR